MLLPENSLSAIGSHSKAIERAFEQGLDVVLTTGGGGLLDRSGGLLDRSGGLLDRSGGLKALAEIELGKHGESTTRYECSVLIDLDLDLYLESQV